MAIDQLSLYNDALRIIGERRLESLAEPREPRRELDDVWAFGNVVGAVNYCLEQVKPMFASVVDKITASTTNPEFDFTNVFALPANYVAMLQAYSDSKLDEPLTRYIIQGRTLAADQTPLYLRYIASGTPLEEWSPSFARVVSAYLALQIAPRIKPSDVERVRAVYDDALKTSIGRDAWEEPSQRSKPRVRTLTAEWFQIYNDAMFCMSLPQIISVNDDSDRRVAIDAALNTGAVEYLMENTLWHWSSTTSRIDYNPSLDPEWGFRWGFDKPADMERISGVFTDEFQQCPLRDYADEGEHIFCEIQTIYLKYISTPMLNNPTLWPAYFRKYLAAYLAAQVAGLPAVGGDQNKAVALAKERRDTALNNDAMEQPPRRISAGNWTRMRTMPGGRRNRP